MEENVFISALIIRLWQKSRVHSIFVNWVTVRQWLPQNSQVDIIVMHPFGSEVSAGYRGDVLLPVDFQTVNATFWSSLVKDCGPG
jgi:hypothetical protein